MIRQAARLGVFALLAAGALQGCAFMANDGFEAKMGKVKTPAMWTNLEVASLVASKKTLFDHVATWVTGRDCSSPRAEREEPYCIDWPDPPTPPAEVYCYATIARPTCYSRPYTQGNDRMIGFVAASPPR